MPLVLGHANGAAVHRRPEALQQILLELQGESGLGEGIEVVERRILGSPELVAHG